MIKNLNFNMIAREACVIILLFMTSQAQRRSIGRCQPTFEMLIRGQRRLLAEGEVVKPNLCIDCTCTSQGTFKCCLSKVNAGKRFVYPGLICTRCQCADLPYKPLPSVVGTNVGQHCFQGNNLMTCVSSLCINPLTNDPNCIEVRSERDDCCDQCIRSGCYVAWDGELLSKVDNRLAIRNVTLPGSKMIRMTFGETIKRGCAFGECRSPSFSFPGGFTLRSSYCNITL